MTPPARIAAAIDLLDHIEAVARPADATASAYFRARRFIGAKDRADIAERAYGILRRRARLGWRLERAGLAVTPRALILADLALRESAPIDRLDSLFRGGDYAPAPLTREERAAARQFEGGTLDRPDMPEAVAAECPDWAEPELRRAFGARFRPELDALREPAPLDLRVNPLKADRPAVLARLRADGIDAFPCTLSPLGVRLAGRPSVMAHPLYKDGAIEIQDEGSQLVALIADARPGHEVVDFCAGAGGKTLAMAAAMGNKGRVIATDVLAKRLLRARERFRRAGVHNIQTRALEGENDPWIKRHRGRFDRVLVDAPCSGTGTWRRNPDMRWRMLGPGLAELAPLQARLLASAARLVKPGGRLIYATCSLLPVENEDQVALFLAAHPDFSQTPAADAWREAVWPSDSSRGEGGNGPDSPSSPNLRLTPAQHRTDGFFAAIFTRNESA